MVIDSATGRITWTPTADQAGTTPVTAVVRNEAGTAVQSWQIEVTGAPPTPAGDSGGCDCAATEPGGLLVAALVVAWRRRKWFCTAPR